MNTILNIIFKNIPEGKDLAISFSGGLDSSLLAVLARMKNNRVRLYTLSLDTRSRDLEYSRRFAREMGFELVEVSGDLIEIFMRWSGKIDRVKAEVIAGIELVVSKVQEKYIMFGSGSEEIFAGYDRHYRSNDLKSLLRDEFNRLGDMEIKYIGLIASEYNKEALFPIYDRELFEYVMNNYSEEELLRDRDRKKWVLRQACLDILPEYILNRPKQALQYGSRINRIVSRLFSSNPQHRTRGAQGHL
ncbi:MAG: asparagine synthase C-terminal domain-containing protein [Candidatus Micrarchaeota archaeon]|nr:asparagine synthase C-terminal domain-containing protein [Candidatus Micrarchaeota archaeon]MCX8154531.1 asparagine synthase C-terminal domain-containing protein [Candidatus Micrarchaeota archaeon]